MVVGKNKIRVNTADLLAALKAKRSEREKQIEKDQAKYDADIATYNERCAVALEKEAAKFRVGKGKRKGRERFYYASDILPPEPEPPSKSFGTLDTSIKVLEMCAEDSILINADDYRAYLG